MRTVKIAAGVMGMVAWVGAARAAGPIVPAATGYQAVVYFAKPEKGGFDIVNGKVLGNMGDARVKGGISPVVWTSPTEFFRLPVAGNLIGNQVTVTDGKTLAGLAFDESKKQGFLLVWTDLKKPALGYAEPDWAMIRPLDVMGEQIVGYVFPKTGVQPLRTGNTFLFEHGVFQEMTPTDGTPAFVRTTDGVHQFGSMGVTKKDARGGRVGVARIRAAMWNSKADDVVDLTPAGHEGGTIFMARGDTEVGEVDGHAGVWHGTAASFVDMHPAGLTKSVATAISGTVIAGSGQSPAWAAPLKPGQVPALGQHALVWVGGQAEDLHAVLPAGRFWSSEATRIDARGNILGTANDGKAEWTVVWMAVGGDATQPGK